MSDMEKADAEIAGGTNTRIGIFRRIAVERYMGPLESDLPEMVAPMDPGWIVLGIALLATAVVLLW